MKKQIKDYLHLYIGCHVKFIGKDRPFIKNGSIKTLEPENVRSWIKQNDEFKLILRPMSSLTHDEIKAARTKSSEFDRSPISGRWGQKVSYGFTTDPLEWEAQIVFNLIKMGFDVFGLIEAGLAIDKTKLTP